MRPRTFLILLAVLVLLSGAGWWIYTADLGTAPERTMGRPLFREIPVNDIALISIRGPGGGATLRKGDSGWKVSERWDYPADFTRIADFLRKLREVKTGREFPSSPEVLSRLSLRDPSDKEAPKEHKGVRLTLEKAQGIKIESLLLGKHRETDVQTGTPAGRYVMKDGESVVYLADWQIAGPSEQPSSWLNRDLISVRPDQIKSIVCVGKGGKETRYAFLRPDKGKGFEATVPKEGGKVNRSELDRLAETISTLRLSDVAGPREEPSVAEGFDDSVWIEYSLYSGFVYRIYPGGECGGDMCRMRLEVDFKKSDDVKTEGEGDKKAEAKGPEELQREAKELNARLGRWFYLVPSWQRAAFATKAEELFEREKKEGADAPGKAKKGGGV
jgi:hypothetical protein